MHKLSTYLIVVIIFIGCTTARVDTITTERCQILLSEPGKCYYSIKNDATAEWDKSASFIVKITQAVIDTLELTYTKADLAKIKDLQNRVSFRIRDAYTIYEFRNEKHLDLNYPSDTAYVYCALEQAALYRYVDLDTLTTDDLKLKLYKIKQKATITKSRYQGVITIDKLDTYYGEGGRWSEVRELVASSNCPLTQLPLKVQKSLIEMGYEIELTGKLDKSTKTALLDFQKENNLQEGSLDYDTLKKLNIK